MTQTTTRPAQLAPVRIGNGTVVHLGHLSSITGPDGEPRYCSYCPASRARADRTVAGEAVAEEITCKSCQRQAGPEALDRAAQTAEDMLEAARPNREYDHNGECVGCGAPGKPTLPGDDRPGDEPCAPDCGFETGRITPAMMLRAAADRLEQFAHGRDGTDLWSALAASATALLPTRSTGEHPRVEDLVDEARNLLGAWFDFFPEIPVPGVELIDDYAAAGPRRMVAETLHLAAALDDGVEFEELYREHLIGRALRELESYWPEADRVFVGISGSTAAREYEFLGVMDPEKTYEGWNFIGPDEDVFNEAGQLIVDALAISQPDYLTAVDDGGFGVTYQFMIAQTVYGKTLRQ
jgi:hypothetical protein